MTKELIIYTDESVKKGSKYSNFYIGLTTGRQGSRTNYWLHPYRHWILVPTQTEYLIDKDE
jgi:hypothetical protein